MAANVLTERYLYLPSVGFCWLLAVLFKSLWDRYGSQPTTGPLFRAAAGLLAAALVFSCSFKIWTRNEIWHDDHILYATTLQTDEDSYVMHMNLGIDDYVAHNYAGAETHLLRALQLKPDSANVLNALACLYMEEDRFPEAATLFQRAIAARPDWTDPHYNYGRLLKKMGQPDAALEQFHLAVKVGSLNGNAHLFLAQELAERGQYAAAEAEYRRSLELFHSLIAQQSLVDLLIQQGRYADALPMLRSMADEYPFDGPTQLKLARVLEHQGNLAEARKHYQTALDTDPANSEAQSALKRLSP